MKKFTYFIVSLTMLVVLAIICINYYNQYKNSVIDANIKKGLDNIAEKQIELKKLDSVEDFNVNEKDFKFIYQERNAKGVWIFGFINANKLVEFGVGSDGKITGSLIYADIIDNKPSNVNIAKTTNEVVELLKPLLSFKINDNEQVKQLKATVSDLESLIYYLVKKLAESEITSVIDISDCYIAINNEDKMFKVEHIYVTVTGLYN